MSLTPRQQTDYAAGLARLDGVESPRGVVFEDSRGLHWRVSRRAVQALGEATREASFRLARAEAELKEADPWNIGERESEVSVAREKRAEVFEKWTLATSHRFVSAERALEVAS